MTSNKGDQARRVPHARGSKSEGRRVSGIVVMCAWHNRSGDFSHGIDRCPPRKSFWGIASRYSGPRPIATTSVYACEGRELSIGRDTKLHRQVYMDKLGAAQAGAIISDVVTPLQLFLFTLNPHMDLSR